jgi:hypothetical protein
MSQKDVENWQELCRAAFGGRDPKALLEVIRELNRGSQHEEQGDRSLKKGNSCARALEDVGSLHKQPGKD